MNAVLDTLTRTPAAPIIRKAKTARRIAVATVRARPVVLAYHRVATVERDPWKLAVTATEFEGHLAALRASGRTVLPLEELHRRTVDGTAPRGAMAITFDDGYLDNLETAAPILERQGVHATVFVTTGTIGSDGPMWWDRLTEIVLTAPRGAAVDSRGYTVTLADGDDAIDRLWSILTRLSPEERDAELDRIADDLGVRPEATTRMVTEDEVRALDALDHMTVGSHTVNHPKLTLVDHHTRERELVESKATLERILGRPVDLLAYPHGAADADIADAARRAGYRLALTTVGSNVLQPEDDPLLLSRVTVEDWSAARFARILRSLG
jgi:peptidoglycan/xylan/chitin deacetylase (PgdA/CDA1 family)